MGSSYFGEANMMRNERVSGLSSSPSPSSSSSRKGKKNGSEKPKQPQRGLGVAQLEKIRLHAQMASAYTNPPYPSPSFSHEDPRVQAAYSSIPSSSSSSSYAASYGFHPNVVMGVPEYERTDIRYDSQLPRWHHPNAMLETQSFAHPNVTRPFLNLYDSHHRSGSVGSSSQNSESSDNQELDLELRLSI